MTKLWNYFSKRIWAKLYLTVALILLVFVGLLALSNSTFLYKYYVFAEKQEMIQIAEEIGKVDLYSESASEKLSDIIEREHFGLTITDSFGNRLFTSRNSPVADFKGDFSGITKQEPRGKFISQEFTLPGGETLQLTVMESLLENSASIANRFIFYVALVVLFIALISVFFISKRITKSIAEMNKTARALAKLDFSQKVNNDSNDEIGELANSINELSDNLDKTLRDLEEKNRLLRSEIDEERKIDSMRKEFIASVSHELKTPIAIISGYAEGLKLDNLTKEEREEYLSVIGDESVKMNNLVLQLLELSRMQSGQITLQEENYDLSEQVERAVKRLNLRYEGKVIECDLKPTMVFADYLKIEEVINNYINNAMSHLSKDGKVKVKIEEENEYAKLSVYNDGENIDAENMENIWQSFFRGDSSHNRQAERVGLGLSIVKTIMELHGTSCGIVNEQNGVTFWFTLKLSKK